MPKLNRNCFTYWALVEIAKICSKDGIFSMNAAKRAIKNEYPQYSRIFSTPLRVIISNFSSPSVGFTEKIDNTFPRLYKIKDWVVDQLLDDIIGSKSKIPSYFLH